jgi:hypothetical protein
MSAIRIMFGAAAALAALTLVGHGSTVAAKPERTLRPGQTVEWTADENPGEMRLRAGDMRIAVVPVREEEGLVGPRVTVFVPGKAPVTLDGDRAGLSFPSRITVGRWDKAGALYVMLESYTGGAHCCDHVQVAVPDGAAMRVVDLGAYDGERIERMPSDLDGDGIVDFAFRDDRFLYAFSSYADSYAPPLVLNVVDGKAVDVSARPGFRKLFEGELARTRKACLASGKRAWEGSCPAFAAASARVGRFDEAWGQMIARRGEVAGDGEWLPKGCTVKMDEEGMCPEGSEIVYKSYAEALRAFLVRTGYIER